MKTNEEYLKSFNEEIFCKECGHFIFKVYERSRSSGNKLVCINCGTEVIKGRTIKS